MDAIARSAHITAAGEVRSRSPSASPPYHRSRSPSAAYGHGAGYHNAGSVSPGRYTRPFSASPAYHHTQHRDSYGYDGASPYHSPAQQGGREEYYGAGAGPGAGAGSPYRPVSAPPGPHSPTGQGAWQGAMGAAGAGSPYAPDVSEAQHILDMINQADRWGCLGEQPRCTRRRGLATAIPVPFWGLPRVASRPAAVPCLSRPGCTRHLKPPDRLQCRFVVPDLRRTSYHPFPIGCRSTPRSASQHRAAHPTRPTRRTTWHVPARCSRHATPGARWTAPRSRPSRWGRTTPGDTRNTRSRYVCKGVRGGGPWGPGTSVREVRGGDG